MRVPAIKNITVKTADQGTAWTLDKTQTNAHEFFFYIECICNGWFTFEILVSAFQSFELFPSRHACNEIHKCGLFKDFELETK